MPSPLAHAAAGYAVYEIFRQRGQAQRAEGALVTAKRFILVVVLTMLPDVDSVVGLLSGNFGRFHNNATHSLFVGLLAAAIVGLLMSRVQAGRFAPWFFLTLLLFELHVVMDYFTIGRGVMAFWPFTAERYLAPVSLFYGFHWSDGLLSVSHLWTIVTETAFSAALFLLLAALGVVEWSRGPLQLPHKRQQMIVDFQGEKHEDI